MSALYSQTDSRLIVLSDIFWQRVSLGALIIFGNRDLYDSILLISLCDTVLLSSSLGGLLTVIFPHDLFLPLIPAAAISFTALVVVYFFVLEPVSDNADLLESENERERGDVFETVDAPEKLNKFVFANIVIGSFIDNVGSLGIYREYIHQSDSTILATCHTYLLLISCKISNSSCIQSSHV